MIGANLSGSHARAIVAESPVVMLAGTFRANLLIDQVPHVITQFIGCDLSGASFAGATLDWADFTGADLRGANFQGTQARGINLSGAAMRGVNFQGANLQGAYYDTDTYWDPDFDPLDWGMIRV